MRYQLLGTSGLRVSALGLGCMGMSPVYGPVNDDVSLRVLHRYVDLGGNFLDTAERYGPFDNEILLGRFLREVPRDRLVIATKFGFQINPVTRQANGLDSSPANIVKVCEASMKRMGTDVIDLFYQHRVDPKSPIEETVSVMAELVKAGKVRALGLSEASASTLRRAAAVHPIAALQSEYSLWTRDVEANGVLTTCQEVRAAFVAYSPLGRGFLTGTIEKPSDLAPGDWRRSTPRFQNDALARNTLLTARLKGLAAGKHCTAGQLALAWLVSRGREIIPIPGSKQLGHLEENMAADKVHLTSEEIQLLDAWFPLGVAVGARYSPSGMASLETSCK